MIYENHYKINNKTDYNCTIIYKSNGGEGTMDSDTYIGNAKCIIRE